VDNLFFLTYLECVSFLIGIILIIISLKIVKTKDNPVLRLC